jgi:hypothetical protein
VKMRHHPVFYKKPKPDDDFYYSIGKSSTTTHWNPPTYDSVYNTLKQIKNNTDIFDRYDLLIHGKFLCSYETKDLDISMHKKGSTLNYLQSYDYSSLENFYKSFVGEQNIFKIENINLNELENDFKLINDIGFSNRLLIDPVFSNIDNYQLSILNYKKLKLLFSNSDSINNNEKNKIIQGVNLVNFIFWEKYLKDIFTLKPIPIIKKINDETGILNYNSSKYIELKNITPNLCQIFKNKKFIGMLGGTKSLNKVLKNPNHEIINKFNCEEFLSISEEEFKYKTNHNKNLIL